MVKQLTEVCPNEGDVVYNSALADERMAGLKVCIIPNFDKLLKSVNSTEGYVPKEYELPNSAPEKVLAVGTGKKRGKTANKTPKEKTVNKKSVQMKQVVLKSTEKYVKQKDNGRKAEEIVKKIRREAIDELWKEDAHSDKKYKSTINSNLTRGFNLKDVTEFDNYLLDLWNGGEKIYKLLEQRIDSNELEKFREEMNCLINLKN